MYQIRAKDRFFRPYFIGKYEVNDIIFFNGSGKVLSTGRGWVDGTDNEDLNPFDIGKVPILKNKPVYDRMYADGQPFFIREKSDRWHKNRVVLYVPYIPAQWEVTDKVTEWGTTRSFSKIHTNTVQHFVVSVYVRAEDITDKSAFVNKVTDLGELMGFSKSNSNQFTILANRDKIIAAIKAFEV
jgi:hypothetical protein